MFKQLLRMAALCIAAAGLVSAAPLAPANIAGQWQFTVELAVGTGRPLVTFKQDGEKITGTYHGMYGPADVTGTIKLAEVTLSVTVHGSTAHFSGKLTSATRMSGMVTGTSDQPRKWSAEKKK